MEYKWNASQFQYIQTFENSELHLKTVTQSEVNHLFYKSLKTELTGKIVIAEKRNENIIYI